MTNPIPWRRLKELAEEATPGPWHCLALGGDEGEPIYSSDTQKRPLAETFRWPDYDWDACANADFIAALNPSAVLAMVAEHAAVRGALVELVACKRKDEQMNRMVPPGSNQDALLYELDDFHSRFAMAWADAAALTGGEK